METFARTMARAARWWLAAAWALSLAPSIEAQQVAGGGGWSPAANAAGDNTYQGFIDRPGNGDNIPLGSLFHVSGWIVDTTAEGWAGIDDVQVLNGGTLLAHASVAQSRADVASATGNPYWAASGFDAVVPSAGLSAGPANLTVVAHTPGKGSWSKQVSVTVAGGGSVLTSPSTTTGLVLRLIFPGPGDTVLANNNGVINGVAYDTRTRAELGVGVDRVQVCLDGPCGVANSQTLGTAVQTGNTWSLAWQPTKYDHVRHHVLFVYARSNVTGEERLLNLEFDIVPF
ncbi:MAG TPA: hypothetical protein VKV73_00815 [Chloroflexota bacterium]|nr:hypothetical protein [Chloroflexota bacterium]